MNENNEKMKAIAEETESYLEEIREDLKQAIKEARTTDDSVIDESEDSKESILDEESQNIEQVCVEDFEGNVIAELPIKIGDTAKEEQSNDENVDVKESDYSEKEDITNNQETMTLEEVDELLNENLKKDNSLMENEKMLDIEKDNLLEEENNNKKESFLQKIGKGILFVLETIVKVGVEIAKCGFGLLTFLGYTIVHPVKSFKNMLSYDNKVTLNNRQNHCLSEYEIENNDIKAADYYEDLDNLKTKYNAEHDYTYTILTLTEGIKLTSEANSYNKEEILKDINGKQEDNDNKLNNDNQYVKFI